MSMSMHEELRLTLEENPDSLRSDQLMGELFWKVLEVIEKPNQNELAKFSEVTSDLARQIFGRAKPEPLTWQVWYAGQMQGVAGLLRTLLGRQLALETTAVLRSRKNSRPILIALATKDSRISDLSKELDLDDSHLGRELRVLVRHNLVETVKEGRWRWARITTVGRKALNEIIEADVTELDVQTGGSKVPAEWVIGGVPAEDFHNANAALKQVFPNLKEKDLTQSPKKLHPTLIAA
jgi:DNA-binding MarR family transcriptional regulator